MNSLLLPYLLVLLALNPTSTQGQGGGQDEAGPGYWNSDFQEEENEDYNNPNIVNPQLPPLPNHYFPVTPDPETQVQSPQQGQGQGQGHVPVPAIPLPTLPPPPPKSYTPLLYPPVGFDRRRSRTKGKVSNILVGDICDPTDPVYSKCSGNAECALIPGENLYKCNCSFSYEVTSTKKCLRSRGQYCDSKDPCNHESFLSCVDNRCDCENSEVYQNGPDKCQSKVGGPCSPVTGPECVPNSVCLSFDTYGRTSRCICKDGYVETSTGSCSPGVGMPCHGAEECNPAIPLVCKEGVCSCREAVHLYDPDTISCVGLVGAQCCTNFDGVDCPYNITNGCVTGAFCKKTSRNLPGRCACQSYNVESEDRTCSPNPLVL